jgi:hypothetical protein
VPVGVQVPGAPAAAVATGEDSNSRTAATIPLRSTPTVRHAGMTAQKLNRVSNRSSPSRRKRGLV